tara:strand:+ start:1165 stop:2790 length:1626 start_codon:yes stop_codon:yes gene_type:complete
MAEKPEKPKSFRDPDEPETRAERLLADCVLSGEIADVSDFKVDADKNVRATFLRGLCLNAEQRNIDPRGIQLVGARITGTLDLEGAVLDRPLLLIACIFIERLTFRGAKIKSLVFGACTLPGISADRLSVEGWLSFKDTTVTGETRVPGVRVTGDMNCDKATFTNKGGKAVFADGMEVGGLLSFNGATVVGETRIQGAKIIGPIECSKATFTNPDGRAFNADGATVGGDLFFRGAALVGETGLLGASIAGDVDCSYATFTSESGRGFCADDLKVGGRLIFRELKAPVVGEMSLNHASVNSLFADGSGWPNPGLLDLDGFRYRALGAYHPWTILLGWIERQSLRGFTPQPYEQAMKVYREAGHIADAREMGIAKMEAYRKYGDLSPAERVWLWIAGPLIKYGYKPWRALYCALGVFALSVFVFAYAFDAGHMEPSKERVYLHECYQLEEPSQPCAGWERPARWWVLASPYRLPVDYPAFNPITYSLDTIIPIVDLHQESYWLPRDTKPGGWFFRAWHWLHIGLGWMLTTLFVTGLTGIVKKD